MATGPTSITLGHFFNALYIYKRIKRLTPVGSLGVTVDQQHAVKIFLGYRLECDNLAQEERVLLNWYKARWPNALKENNWKTLFFASCGLSFGDDRAWKEFEVLLAKKPGDLEYETLD